MDKPSAAIEKPRQSIAGLWNISFGFVGIQIGFALQNANMSRIFQSLGSSLDDLPALWVAAPLTGLLVQPIVGHMSDRTWLGRLGRRRPYFLAGAILAALSLFLMPLAPALLMAALLLWMLDASLNISMEPFRAFVGDMLRKDQHTAGYAVQTAFIGVGAVIGSIFPWVLDQLGVSNVAPDGGIPDTVRFSFWFGGAALFLAVLWTILSTKEYSPEEMRSYREPIDSIEGNEIPLPIAAFDSTWLAAAAVCAAGSLFLNSEIGVALAALLFVYAFRNSARWVVAGILMCGLVGRYELEKEMYVLGGLLIAYGLLSEMAQKSPDRTGMLSHIVGDFAGMPPVMKRLALVQFFSWSALFIMWINTTPVVAQDFFGSADPASAGYQAAGNWVGVLFAIYNGVAAVAALTLLPLLAAKFGKAVTHMIGLLAGAAGFASFFVIQDPDWLVLSEIGIGIAWASILAMPYAILASNLPQRKLGIYMGLFNIFIVVPQLLVATVMGSIMKAFFPGEPIWTMLVAAIVMTLAAAAMLRVRAVERVD